MLFVGLTLQTLPELSVAVLVKLMPPGAAPPERTAPVLLSSMTLEDMPLLAIQMLPEASVARPVGLESPTAV